MKDITINELIEKLCELGFEKYSPSTTTYKLAIIASNKENTLYVLIRKNGVDYNYYNFIVEKKFTCNGKLSVAIGNGKRTSNHYYKCTINLHNIILTIASLFINNQPMPDYFLHQHGQNNIQRSLDYSNEIMDDMLQIYRACAHEDGEDAYLGDGLWITSDGRTYED